MARGEREYPEGVVTESSNIKMVIRVIPLGPKKIWRVLRRWETCNRLKVR